jgi:serine/threonine protein kinase/Flp pilus assembly protein TadD
MTAPAAESKSNCEKCGALLEQRGNLVGHCLACLLGSALNREEVEMPDAKRFDHYQIVTNEDGTPAELGRGAMGITFRAADTILGHEVALKLIDPCIASRPEAQNRFLREAQTAARLRHPNAASVFYYGVRKTDGKCFYAMELIKGETVEARLRRCGPMSPALALEVVAQVARVLIAADALGLVHRDLKPANVMLVEGPELTVKLIDFGLAKTSWRADTEGDRTHVGFLGTPAFASPEQLNDVRVDIRSDLYSLGVTLWKMLTGKLPFQGPSVEMVYQHQHASLPLHDLKEVPQPLVVLLRVLLEKDPTKRLQSPSQLLEALSAVRVAIMAKQSIIRQSLQAVDDKALNKSQRWIRKLWQSGPVLKASKRNPVLWFTIAIVIAGVLSLLLGFGRIFSGPSVGQVNVASSDREMSIAVLPFESLSEEKGDTYFADGVQDEIISNLAKVSHLKVIGRSSVMGYRPGRTQDLRSIANLLGVAHLLEGTVRRNGNRVRVTTELIDSQSEITVWSDSYDRELTDIFAIQSDIAQTVASRLSVRLSTKERKEIAEKPTNDFEAYDLYLKAKELIDNTELFEIGDEGENLLNAIGLLEEATRKDAKFTLAYCLMVEAHDDLYWHIDRSETRRLLGDAAVNQALLLRPDLPEVHLAQAKHIYACYRDYDRVRAQISIIQRKLPNNPDAFALAAKIDRRRGLWEDSTKDLEKAVNLDPRNIGFISDLVENYQALRRYREAEKLIDKLVAFEPDKMLFRADKALSPFLERADLASFRSFLESTPPSAQQEMWIVMNRFYFAALEHDWVAAEKILDECSHEELIFFFDTEVPRGCVEAWLAMVEDGRSRIKPECGLARNQLKQKIDTDPNNPKLLSALAIVDVALGHKDDAIEEAKRAVSLRPISEDALDGPTHVYSLAVVYARTNETDLAFEQLALLAKTSSIWTCYGFFKYEPGFDPIRKDPRFDRLLAQLAPHE